jgi:hypothetical protein
MARLSLLDGSTPFEATLLESPNPHRLALFAVGGGGNPERHLPLLTALAAQGITVIAPHYERLLSPNISEPDLLLRARRLRLALDAVAHAQSPVIGVGHSIGTTILLAMAGAQAWLGPGRPLPIPYDERLQRLILLTPATGFFRAPAALDGVRISIQAWAGTKDTVTPPSQAQFLQQSLPIELHIEEGANHFSFMHLPPPHVEETLPDRDAFLDRLTAAVVRFATADPPLRKTQSHHSKIIPNPFIPIHKQPLSPPPGKPEN